MKTIRTPSIKGFDTTCFLGLIFHICWRFWYQMLEKQYCEKFPGVTLWLLKRLFQNVMIARNCPVWWSQFVWDIVRFTVGCVLISKICDRVLGAKWSIAMQLCSLHLKVWSLYWDNHWIICALESAMALCTLNGLTARFDSLSKMITGRQSAKNFNFFLCHHLKRLVKNSASTWDFVLHRSTLPIHKISV